MSRPAASASESRSRTTTPQPSPRTKPSARASKVLQRPSAASMPSLAIATHSSGASTRLTAPTMARSHSPASRLRQARWTATSEDEQAVSTTRLGPRRSSR
ncbi:hypothetical protein BE18_15425 [Sorangium cellulosum]|uniref:Uncharacterized protein n=1 Tax=Sorangium cellulosum TaxID=56 RepID=A0A150S2M5_SORCE|nr:hypothetical protein BE18_15425 [Sorangium cellulosum]